MRVFVVSAVGRVEFAHPAADGNTEKGRRMDDGLVEKAPFFLLYRVGGEGEEGGFQFLHKRRVVRFGECDNFLIPQILIDIRRVDLLRGNELQIAGHCFQVRAGMLHGMLCDFLPQELLIFCDRRVQIFHPEILRQQSCIARFDRET